MSAGDWNSLGPWFEHTSVPCEGKVGDIVVITPLKQDERDPSQQGLASLWFCIMAQTRERPAVWARISFDGVATCAAPVPNPPQTRPTLTRG